MLTSPVVLLILDGWGFTRNNRGNAIRDAYTPVMDQIAQFYPSLTLQASGFSVGMLWGEPGNSATGHTALGTGRIIYNHLPRILHEIRNESFFENPVLLGAIHHAKTNHSILHLIGLISGASIHSYLDHVYGLFELAKRHDIQVLLHAFTDGRDSPPQQAIQILESLLARISENEYPVRLASVMGRSFAMDRAGSWDRVECAYQALTQPNGNHVTDLLAHLRKEYGRGVTDEFITPVKTSSGETGDYVKDRDAVIFFNFREDGMRELCSAFADPTFSGFQRRQPENIYIATFTEYAKNLPVGVAFPSPEITNPLSAVLSQAGVKQLKVSESQKFAQVTYFFNGGREEPYKFEDRVIFPTDTAPASQNPDMQSAAISEEVARAVTRTAHEFIVVNMANADAAAHSGDYHSVIRAIEAMDRAIERIYNSIIHTRGALLITSDHGSAEELFNTRTGEMKTGHSENPVPFYYVTNRNRLKTMRDEKEIQRRHAQPLGVLADVAPTILDLLSVKKPAEMTGQSLLKLL